MSVNKFGQFSNELYSTAGSQRQVQTSLKRTRDGDFDAAGKRIINVAIPIHENDVTNRSYIDSEIVKLKNAIADLTKKLNANKTKTAENKQSVQQVKGNITELMLNKQQFQSKLDLMNDAIPQIVVNKCATIQEEFKQKLELDFNQRNAEVRDGILEVIRGTNGAISNVNGMIQKKLTNLKYTVIINLVLNLKQDEYEVLNSNSNSFVIPLNGEITHILYNTDSIIYAKINSKTSMPNAVVKKGDKIQFLPEKTNDNKISGEYPQTLYVEMTMLTNVLTL